MGNEYYIYGDPFSAAGGAEAGEAVFLGAFFLVYGLIILFTLAVSIASYVLHSLGLYTIAQRRRIRKPWLAWIPVGNLWLLGSISDQYRYIAKGEVKNRRKIMLGLSIATAAIYFIWLVVTVLGAVTGIGGIVTVLLSFLGLPALAGLAITLTVFEYICYYDLFSSCEKTNGTLYLILSILFSAVMPVLVFACRKKDDGMPVRRQSAPTPVSEPVMPAEEPIAPVATPEEENTEEIKEEPNAQEEPVADA